MGALWLRFGAELRGRWRVWCSLALLIGAVGGIVIALVAGARRTDSAYDRFLRAERAYDVLYYNDGNTEAALLDPAQVAALPEVAEVAHGAFFYAEIGPGIGSVIPLDDSLGRKVNRLRILEGRLPRPGVPNEAAISFALAEQYHLRVGDTFPIYARADAPEDLSADQRSLFERFKRTADALGNRVHIVGIEATPGEFPPQFGTGRLLVHFSPSFMRGLGTIDENDQPVLMIRLRHGTRDVERFQHDVAALAHGKFVTLETQQQKTALVQRTLHVQAEALWILAALTAIASVLVLGQVLARNAFVEADEHDVLAALGTTRGQRAALGGLRALLVASIAAVTAVVVAVLCSPLFPRGLARIAEPQHGIDVDARVLLLGAVSVLVLAAALTALPAGAVAYRRSTGDGVSGVRLADAVARRAGSAPVSVGVRLALSSGRGRQAVPVRTTVSAVAMGVAVLIGALTFGGSLDHLLATPRLYGTTWDVALENFVGPIAPDDRVAARATPGVRAVAVGDAGIPLRHGKIEFETVVADRIVGDALPPMVEGRRPDASDEIALGRRTLHKLHVRLGDTVSLALGENRPRPVRVVGRVVLPAIGDRGGLGDGGYLTLKALLRLFPAASDLGTPGSLFVGIAPGASRAHVLDALRRRLGDVVVIEPRKPTDLLDFGRVRSTPLALGAVLALVSAAALVHLMVIGVQRRRRDLATCKALGFTRAQVSAAVVWQATVTVTLAVALGLPVGLLAGRVVWTSFARQLGVQVVTHAPVPAIVGVLVGMLVLGDLVASWPARRAARTPPALVLRSE